MPRIDQQHQPSVQFDRCDPVEHADLVRHQLRRGRQRRGGHVEDPLHGVHHKAHRGFAQPRHHHPPLAGRFAVHLDPVNFINTPAKLYDNAALLRECFAQLGPHIRAVHAKDIVLEPRLTVHLDEVRPGLGVLDYPVLLREVDRLDPDMPLLVEHLGSDADYAAAVAHVRGVAESLGIAV